MTADVQRELAEAVMADPGLRLDVQRGRLDHAAVILTLLPTVQALIADAEKRAAARALREAAEACRRIGVPGQARAFDAHAAALDPSGAAEGAGR